MEGNVAAEEFCFLTRERQGQRPASKIDNAAEADPRQLIVHRCSSRRSAACCQGPPERNCPGLSCSIVPVRSSDWRCLTGAAVADASGRQEPRRCGYSTPLVRRRSQASKPTPHNATRAIARPDKYRRVLQRPTGQGVTPAQEIPGCVGAWRSGNTPPTSGRVAKRLSAFCR